MMTITEQAEALLTVLEDAGDLLNAIDRQLLKRPNPPANGAINTAIATHRALTADIHYLFGLSVIHERAA